MTKNSIIAQLPVDSQKKYRHHLSGIYFIYGTRNVGKTTLLARLAFLLSMLRKHSAKAREETYLEFMQYKKEHHIKDPKKKNAFPDIRVIVHYGYKKYAYIATPGDDIVNTEANLHFFEGRLDYKVVYILKNQKLRPLSEDEKDYYQCYQPTLCLSACRTRGLVELPLKYFADKKHNSTDVLQWIRITKVPKKKIKITHRRNSTIIMNHIKSILKKQ